VTAKAAARLNETPDESIRSRPYSPTLLAPGARENWEHAPSPVEVIVNGKPVARHEIVADGKPQDLSFDVKLDRSSWVAMRILPSSHTNPVFVVIDGKPIRASKASAEWCLKGVDQCWSQKRRFIPSGEMQDAESAYEHAREAYRRVLAESVE